MFVKNTLVGLGLVIGALGVALPVCAEDARTATAAQLAALPSAPPATVIEAFHAGLLAAMHQGPAVGGEARFRKLAPVVERTFNLPLMTEVAVGQRWSGLSPAQQGKLIDAFRRFTIASYVNHFDSYDGQRFEVEPAPQPVAGGMMVLSRLLPRNKGPIALNYVMRETGGTWQAIDVYAEGTISELARRRSEFNAVLNRTGVDGLADRLVERAQSLIDQPA